jgi:hypothetical protein
MKGYDMSDVIDWGVDLWQLDECDWHYDAQFDVVFPRPGSKLYTWLALFDNHKTSTWSVENV